MEEELSIDINALTGLNTESTSTKPVDTNVGEVKDNSNPNYSIDMGELGFEDQSGIIGGIQSGIANQTRSIKGYDLDAITDYTGEDINIFEQDAADLRAAHQSTSEQWLNGIGKAGITFTGAVLENTLGVAAGLASLVSGGKYYDNFIGHSVDNMNNWAQEAMPNFQTNIEQESSAFSATNLLSANFWGDKVLNGLAYSLGSIATMYLTGGVGMGTLAGRALGMTKLIKNGLVTGQLGKAVATGSKLADVAGKLEKASTTGAKLINGAKYLDAALTMSLAESSVEARETYETGKQRLIDRYVDENNLKSSDQIPANVMAEIDSNASSMANANFLMNTVITSGTNMLQFGKMISPGFKASAKMSDDFIQEGGKILIKTPKTKFDKFLNISKKIGNKASGALEEAAQEGGQFMSNIGAQEYYLAEMFNETENAGILNSGLKAFEEAFGSKEGIESMLIGAIVGGGSSALSSLYNRISTGKSEEDQIKQRKQDLLDSALGAEFIKTAKEKFTNKNKMDYLLAEMDDALKAKDIRRFKTAQHWMLFNQMKDVVDSGTEEHYKYRLDMAKELSDKDFKEQFGFQPDKTLASKEEIIEDIKTKLDEFSKQKEKLDLLFNESTITGVIPRLFTENPDEKNNKILNRQLAKDLLLANLTFANDVDSRIDKIFDNISELTNNKVNANVDNIGNKIGLDNKLFKETEEFKDQAIELERKLVAIKSPRLRAKIESMIDTINRAYNIGIDKNKLFAEKAVVRNKEAKPEKIVNSEVSKIIEFLNNRPTKNAGLDNKDILNLKSIFNTLTEINDTTANPAVVEEVVRALDDALVLTTQRSEALHSFNDLLDHKENAKTVNLLKVKKDQYYANNIVTEDDADENLYGYRQMRLARLVKVKKVIKDDKEHKVTISPDMIAVDENKPAILADNEHYEIVRRDNNTFYLAKVVDGKYTKVAEKDYVVDEDGIHVGTHKLFIKTTAREKLEQLYAKSRKQAVDKLVEIKTSTLATLKEDKEQIDAELKDLIDLLENTKVKDGQDSENGKLEYTDSKTARKHSGLQKRVKEKYNIKTLTPQVVLDKLQKILAYKQQVAAQLKTLRVYKKDLIQEQKDLKQDIAVSNKDLRVLSDETIKDLVKSTGMTYDEKIKELEEDKKMKEKALEKLIGINTTIEKVEQELSDYVDNNVELIEIFDGLFLDYTDPKFDMREVIKAYLEVTKLYKDYDHMDNEIPPGASNSDVAKIFSEYLERHRNIDYAGSVAALKKFRTWERPRAFTKQAQIDNIIEEIDTLEKAMKNELDMQDTPVVETKKETEATPTVEMSPEDVTNDDVVKDQKEKDSKKPSFKQQGFFRLWSRHFLDDTTINPEEYTKRFYKFNEVKNPKEFSIMFVSIDSHPEYFKDLLENPTWKKENNNKTTNIPLRGVYINPTTNAPVDFDGNDIVGNELFEKAIFSNVPALEAFTMNEDGNKTTLPASERAELSKYYYDIDKLTDQEIIDQMKDFFNFRKSILESQTPIISSITDVSTGIFNTTAIWKSLYETFNDRLDKGDIELFIAKTKGDAGVNTKPGLAYIRFKNNNRVVPVSTRNLTPYEIQNVMSILEVAAKGNDSVKDSDGNIYPITDSVQQWISKNNKEWFNTLENARAKEKKNFFTITNSTNNTFRVTYHEKKGVYSIQYSNKDLLSQITYTSTKGKYPFKVIFKKETAKDKKTKPFLIFGNQTVPLTPTNLKKYETDIRQFLLQKKTQLDKFDSGKKDSKNKRIDLDKSFKEVKLVNPVDGTVSFNPEMKLQSYLFGWASDTRKSDMMPIQTNLEVYSARDVNKVQFKSSYPSYSRAVTVAPANNSETDPEVVSSAGVTKTESAETPNGEAVVNTNNPAATAPLINLNEGTSTQDNDMTPDDFKIFSSPGITTFADNQSLGMSVSDFMKTLPKEERQMLREMLNANEIKFNCN